MYAVAVDGELLASDLEKEQVLAVLKDREIEEKVEVATFQKGVGWVPICIESLALSAN